MTTDDSNSHVSRSAHPSVPPLAGPAGASATTWESSTTSSFPAPPHVPQLSLDEVEPGRSGAFSAEHALNEQIDDLERWVGSSLRQQRRTAHRFWLLRAPAMLAALLAIGAGALGFATVFAGLAAAVALLLATDAVWSAATSRSPLRRALYDLRELQNTVKLRWDRVRLAHPDPDNPKRVAYALALLDSIQVKRDEVNRYLVGLVPSPSVGRQPF